jgi:hypothetical protein
VFQALKHRFTTEPILRHYQPRLETKLETDASYFAIGAVFFQNHDGVWCPVAYISRPLNAAKRNYDVHDKEMLAIVFSCLQGHPLLLSLDNPLLVAADHSSLQWFMRTKRLNRRQTRWSEALADFKFVIQYRTGKTNNTADALSRRDAALLLSGGASYAPDESSDHTSNRTERPYAVRQLRHTMRINSSTIFGNNKRMTSHSRSECKIPKEIQNYRNEKLPSSATIESKFPTMTNFDFEYSIYATTTQPLVITVLRRPYN